MQFYTSDDETNLQIAIIFEDKLNELPFGIRVMEDIIKAMKKNGAEGVLDTERWLSKIKTQRLSQQVSRYV